MYNANSPVSSVRGPFVRQPMVNPDLRQQMVARPDVDGVLGQPSVAVPLSRDVRQTPSWHMPSAAIPLSQQNRHQQPNPYLHGDVRVPTYVAIQGPPPTYPMLPPPPRHQAHGCSLSSSAYSSAGSSVGLKICLRLVFLCAAVAFCIFALSVGVNDRRYR